MALVASMGKLATSLTVVLGIAGGALTAVCPARAAVNVDNVYASPSELGVPLTNTTVYAVASSTVEAPLTYAWMAVAPPHPVAFADASTNITGVTFGGPGDYLLRVTIAENPGESVDVDLPVTVATALTFTVTYDANGADSGTPPDPQTKTYGVALTIAGNTGNLAKTGATFGGWNAAPDGSDTNYAAGDAYTNETSATLYANWNANAGNLVPNRLFSNYMLLQRRARVPIWGTDTPGTTVTVEFRGQSKSAVTGGDGKWMVFLDPMEHGGPFTMTISNSLGNSVNRYDVLVGDVFLASGQSNMEWAAASANADGSAPITTFGTNNVDADTMAVIDQAAANPNIRISSWTRDHLDTPNKGWSRVLASQRLITPALPVCIVQKMQVAQGIPVGVIVRAESGTSMIRWIVAADFNNDPVIIAEKADTSDGSPQPLDPVGDLWTKYIAPTVPYAIRGFLWDQGEWGIGYRGVTWTGAMHALLDSWRTRFGQGDLPWTCTSHYDYTLQTILADVGTPMVVIANTWGLSGALHPLNKDEYADKHVEEYMPIVYGGVPMPWYVSDVGATGLRGFEMKYSTQFVLTSTGGGIGGTADSFRFMNQGANGDCQIVVRIHGMLNASPDAKAGIMIRDTLDPDASAVGVWLTPTVSTPNTTAAWSANVATSVRSSAGATTTTGATTTLSPTYPGEFWLRLARFGNEFNADCSTNGVNWMPLGTSVTVNMSPDVHLGTGVCSGQTNVSTSATFYQVEVDMQPDQTPPALESIDDGDADDTVAGGDWLNYTVSFSEDINEATVTAADFDNAGTADVLFGTVVKTASGVFTVPVRPMTAGSVVLRIHGTAVIADVSGNFLVVPVQDDTTVTVVGDAPRYTVTFDANGAHSGTAPPPQTKINGLPLTLALNSGNLAKTDAVFAGWNTEADGTGATYLAGSTYNIDAPATLYARWVPLTPEGAFEIYVTTTGSDANTGSSWSEALLQVSTAIARAKDGLTQSAISAVIYVGTGTFPSGGQLLLDQPIAVVGGTQDPGQASVVQGNGTAGNYRVFRLTHAGARLEGLTVQNGYSSATSSPDPGRGGNIHMSAGLVTNCLIRNAFVRDGSRQGGGLYMSGGIVADCTIANNYVFITSQGTTGFGGGVYMAGGELRRCRVNANYFSLGSSNPATITCYGGGVYVNHTSAVVQSCLIDGNYSPNDGTANSAGGGVYLASGTVRNCTVVKNSCRKTTITHTGGGLRQAGGVLLNTIVWNNTVAASTAANYWDGGTPRDVTYSCATELAGGTGNIAADPLFIAPASGDYRLPVESPCVDTGLNEAWMTTGFELDDEPRIQGARVDMGAYETSGGPLSITSIGANPSRLMLPASTSTVYVVAVSQSNAPLTYAWSQVSGGGTAVFDTPTASNSVVAFSTNGVYGLQAVVSDNLGNSVTGTVAVTVNNPAATYPVTYDANGADSGTAPEAQTKIEGIALTLATNSGNLEKTNLVFAGWNTADDGSGTDYAAGGTYTANAALTLYAKWAEAGLTSHTWDGGGGSSSWDAGDNWYPDGAPTWGNDVDITFNAVGAARLGNFIGTTKTIRSLTFNADADSAVTVRPQDNGGTGGSLNLTLDADSGDATINVDADSTGNHTIGVVGAGGQIVLLDNLVINHDGQGTLTFGRRLNDGSGTASVTKNGTGQMTFANDTSSLNNYDGGFIMNAGTVVNNSAAGFGTADITFNGGTIRNSNVTIANNVVVENTGNLKTWQYSNANNATYQGNFTLNETTFGSSQIEITGSGNLLFDGLISGDGGIEKIGSGGFLRLGQLGANTYTGNTKVTAGELRLNNLAAIQNSALHTAGSGFITANAGAGNYVIGGLISGRDLASVMTGNPANVTTLTLNPLSSTVTYSNAIGDLSTGMALIKSGAGTQVLGGDNTYTGTTTVNGGTLRVSGSTAGGAVTVNSGAKLGGTGTLGGNVTIRTNGVVAPGGVSTPGTLTLNNTALTLESGAKLNYRLGGTNDAVAGVDMLTLNGQQWSDFTFATNPGFGPGAYILIAAADVSGSLGATVEGSVGGYSGRLRVSVSDFTAELWLLVDAVAAPPVLTDVSVTAGAGISFAVDGSGSQVIQASTNLLNPDTWEDVATNTAPFRFADPGAVHLYPRRFYRARTP